MICPNCKIPMKTIDGSEKGIWLDSVYQTSEIKICPNCKLKVRETYRAEKIQ